MADEQPDEGRGYEPSENRHRAAADVQPHLHVLVFDQRQLWPQREPRSSIQENQDFYGQATACLQSLPQTDGGQTIHLGVPVQFPSGNRSTDPLQGISQTRPFGRVQDRQDDLPLMSNEGIYYPPRAGSRSPQDSRFHRGMEVESAGEASHDQSVNPTGMQSLPGEQTLPLAEGERPRQLSGWDDQQEREKSFENAPAIFNSNTQLSAKIMAENGFYFTGFEDYVRCFKCDRVLHTWDLDDDPLLEHIKHGPPGICPYLVSTVNPDFLSDTIKQVHVQHIENGKLSHDIDETACKQHIQDQLNLQQQQKQQQHMSAASGNTAAFQSSSEMNNSSIYVTALPEPYSDTNALSGSYNQNWQAMYRSQTSELTPCPVKTEIKKKESLIHPNADEDFLCQDCRRNKVNHTQQECGHGICGECIRCMRVNGTPMKERKCVTCKRPVVGYTPWSYNY